jgi:VanZ family protein
VRTVLRFRPPDATVVAAILMMNGQRMKKLLRGLWLMAALAIIIGSLLPGDSLPIRALTNLAISDKIEHFAAYLVVVFLPALHERWKVVAATAVAAVLMGIALEYGQFYAGGRVFEVADMIADTLGVCFGLAIGIAARSSAAVRSLLCTDNATYSSSR